jgi:hypothetical protein
MEVHGFSGFLLLAWVDHCDQEIVGLPLDFQGDLFTHFAAGIDGWSFLFTSTQGNNPSWTMWRLRYNSESRAVDCERKKMMSSRTTAASFHVVDHHGIIVVQDEFGGSQLYDFYPQKPKKRTFYLPNPVTAPVSTGVYVYFSHGDTEELGVCSLNISWDLLNGRSPHSVWSSS